MLRNPNTCSVNCGTPGLRSCGCRCRCIIEVWHSVWRNTERVWNTDLHLFLLHCLVWILWNISSIILMSSWRACQQQASFAPSLRCCCFCKFQIFKCLSSNHKDRVTESLWLAGMAFPMTVPFSSIQGVTICSKSLQADTLSHKQYLQPPGSLISNTFSKFSWLSVYRF
jgi:hypothetical protein